MILYLIGFAAIGFGQNITVNGIVTDIDTSEPLPGVSIVIEGTTTGSITNLDGEYTLAVPEGTVLIFSYIGYVKKIIPFEGTNHIKC